MLLPLLPQKLLFSWYHKNALLLFLTDRDRKQVRVTEVDMQCLVTVKRLDNSSIFSPHLFHANSITKVELSSWSWGSGKCHVMAQEESHWRQITKESQEVGLTSKICKPLFSWEETCYMQKNKNKSRTTTYNKPTKDTVKIQDTEYLQRLCHLLPFPALKKRTDQQRSKQRCIGKHIKCSSDFKCDSFE